MVDFSNALFDPKGQLIGQTTNCPVHLAAMHFSVQSSINKFKEEGLEDGDIVVLNDPYQGGTHIPDITFTKPIYYEGEIVAFAASRGHWLDLGGGAFASEMHSATHIAQEGLRLPPVKIFRRGKPVESIIDIIKSNTRVPYYIEGDLRAHLGALKVAEKYMQELVEKYGIEIVRECMEEALDYTEKRTRKAIEKIPNGKYWARDYVDCDGIRRDSVPIEVTLTVKGDEIWVDFTGTNPIVEGHINYPVAGTYSAVYWALKFFLDPDAPPNAGMYRPIHILLPEGVFVNAKWPAPVYHGNLATSERIADTIWKALEQAIPDRMVGFPYGECNPLAIGITEGNSGTSIVISELPPGGWGGTPFHDGMNATYSRHGNCMDLTIELAESVYPIRVERRELIQDSGGPGKFRGGLSSFLAITVLRDAIVGAAMDRTKIGPPGTHGGKAGKPGRIIKNPGKEDEEIWGGYDGRGDWKMSMFDNRPLKAGETIAMAAQGGGGWGEALERDPKLVLEDVLDEYISIKAAEEEYGVVINPKTYEIDYEATEKLRKNLMKKRRER